MRRVSNAVVEEESSIDLTPLIDCVFIMLIFFIVTASFVHETGLDVNKPDAPLVNKKQQNKSNILVSIDANNNIWIGGRKIDVRAVRPNIERLHAENPQGSVVIQADKQSNNEMLVDVMDASRQAGVNNIALAEASK